MIVIIAKFKHFYYPIAYMIYMNLYIYIYYWLNRDEDESVLYMYDIYEKENETNKFNQERMIDVLQ